MDKLTDQELLQIFARHGTDDAFRQIVQRHLGLVRGTAMRQLRNVQQADEVSQAVFIALANKAASLPAGTVVAGWLFKATRFAAAKLARDEGRRVRRETEAAVDQLQCREIPTEDEEWNNIAPFLDGALEALGTKDREAVLLRFFQKQPFAEVGRCLGTSEEAAKMRVGRAMEKMRGYFKKRGIAVAAGSMSIVFSANAGAMPFHALADSIAVAASAAGKSDGLPDMAEAILGYMWVARAKRWLYLCLMALALLGLVIGIVRISSGGNRQPTRAPAWNPPAQQWPKP